jgi:hypothetical protein
VRTKMSVYLASKLSDNALRIFNINDFIDQYDYASREDANQTTLLSIGPRFRLIRNIGVENLINGSMGTVHNILPANTDVACLQCDAASSVEFDGYTLAFTICSPKEYSKPVVPILPGWTLINIAADVQCWLVYKIICNIYTYLPGKNSPGFICETLFDFC